MFLIAHLYRKNSILLLRPGEFHLLKPDFDIMRSLITRGIPMGIQMFVMSRAVIGVLRAAVLEEQPFFKSRPYEGELVRLVLAYVGSVTKEAAALSAAAR